MQNSSKNLLAQNPETGQYWKAHSPEDAFFVSLGKPEFSSATVENNKSFGIFATKTKEPLNIEMPPSANCINHKTGDFYAVDNPDDAFLVTIGKPDLALSARFVSTKQGDKVRYSL